MFSRNLAFITGINNYTNGISPLNTAVNDAKKLVEILRKKHDYEVWECLDEVATLSNFNKFLSHTLPEKVTENDRLLFYFAGHGVALNGDDGPAGYLIPQDALLGDTNSYLPMTKLHDALSQLPCRHFLGILDCCFAGAFKWSSTRDLLTSPEVIHQERYDRFISDPAWQIITSSASDQKALDNFNLDSVRGQFGHHSPFASALLEALEGAADIYPPATNGKPAGDGVITATKLYLYLRDRVEIPTEKCRLRQTPGIWCLNKHDKGEYIFLSPGHELNLPPAPPLDESQNPYRGLNSFEEEHSQLFFGRTLLVEKLEDFVKANPLTVVLGASGSGKSSLVKAGLIPQLKQENTGKWSIVSPIRPGENPFQALNKALVEAGLPKVELQNPQKTLTESIAVWVKNNPKSKLLIFIDQSEEIITLCQDEQERQEFFQQILAAIHGYREQLRVVLSLRSDFEPHICDLGLTLAPEIVNQLGTTVLINLWQSGRFIVPAMTRGELREAIEKPAQARVMYFQPHELVEKLIDEVADMPGALPLLSFALSELYLKYLRRQREAQYRGITIDRALTQGDYIELGGVMRSLTQRADEEYQKLVNENPAYDQVIRHVMLRMVALGGGELARRRVPLSELEYPPAKNSLVKEVIERFSTARLLVEGQDVEGNPDVEPAHDALVRGWQRLLEWKHLDEENLLLQRRLTPAAVEWKSQQQAKFLWNANPRLDLLNKELNSEDNWFNQVEVEFVQRSVRRKSFNTRRNWVVAIVVMLGLGTGLVFSLIGQRDALIGQVRADRQSAEANLELGQDLEALVASLRAGKSLKDWPGYLSLFKPENELKTQVLQTWRKVFYLAKERNRIEVPENFNKMFFTSDHRLLIATAEDGTVRLQDFKGTELPKVFSGHRGEVNLDINKDGSLLATIDDKCTVRLWNLEGKQEEPPKLEESILHSKNCEYSTGLSFSPDGKKLVAYRKAGSDSIIYLWDLTGNEPKLLKNAQDNFMTISFNSDNQLVVATQSDNTLRLSDFMFGTQLEEFKHNDRLNRCYFCDYELYDNLVFSPDGNYFAAIYYKDASTALVGSLSKNSLAYYKPIDSVLEINTNNSVSEISFDANSRLIIGQNTNGMISVYNPVYNFFELKEMKGHQGSIREVISSSNGKIASLGDDKTIRLWEIENNQQVEELSPIEGQFKSLSISPDGKQLAAVKKDGTVHLLELKRKDLKQFKDIKGKISQIIFSPDGQQLAALDEENTIRILNLNGKELYKPKKIEKTISQLIFSRDGQQLAAMHCDYTICDSTIHLFELNSKTKTLKKVSKKSYPRVYPESHIVFNSDNKLLAMSIKNELKKHNKILLELESHKQLVGFEDDNGYISSEKNGLDIQGNLLASIGDSYDIHVWDISGKRLTTLKGKGQPTNQLTSISLSADGSLIATLDEKGTAKLWQFGGLDELLSKSCDRVRDYLENNPNVDKRDRNLCDNVYSSRSKA
ncbi:MULTISPECIES: caspase family protein [Moorena]|uniref:WD-40 repeat-containing protein n=1 Tax=Moorena producens 3L TaxID=489825 RepID=F4Y0I1_9CYAN|nr:MULTISPECIES: caspase family protein [Moorena]EGJ29605.1 WD-40 repeat-containing protein [Moorena producens 3L]NEP66179.1 hypothetical protein [Moorena sp. SIO3A5]OLT65475.1 hypothetical protein BI334_10845 [Moorena producens 3L]